MRRSPVPLGPFDLLKPIGAGGMAQVWRGVHRATGQAVAVKVLTGANAREARVRADFRQEVRAIAGLDHPKVCGVVCQGEVGVAAEVMTRGRLVRGSPYLAMELATGGTLSAWYGRLPERPEVQRALNSLLDHPGARRRELGALNAEDGLSLIQELLGSDGALARGLNERTRGNPEFAVQLVNDWVRRGLLVAGPDGLTLRLGAHPELPDDLHALWASRCDALLAGLASPARQALQLAALLGPEVNGEEWRVACDGMGLEGGQAGLERLLNARLAVSIGEARGNSWRFTQGMLQESLLRGAREQGQLQALHLACAHALQQLNEGGGRGRVGRHLVQAGALSDALRPLIDGAAWALTHDDSEQARSLLDHHDDALRAIGGQRQDPAWDSSKRLRQQLSLLRSLETTRGTG